MPAMADYSPSLLNLRSRSNARPSAAALAPDEFHDSANRTGNKLGGDGVPIPRDRDEDLHPAPACLGLAIAVFFVAIVLYLSSEPVVRPRIWTKEELAIHNGTVEELPILLGILGNVYDVTKGRTHYGVGGSYNHFAGRDATRAFVSGNFTGDGLTDSVRGLSPMQLKSLVDWQKFYNKSYIYMGKLVGTYYYPNGTATKELKWVHTNAKVGIKLLKQQESEEKKHPNCNSRWSQNHGGEVWCDVGYPRLVQKVGELPLTGKVSSRCACYRMEELSQHGLKVYEGCSSLASTCKVS